MINILWHEGTDSLFGADGTHGRKRYAATCMLNDMFDTYDCRHWVRPYDGMPDSDGAVVVFHGGHQKEQVELINRDIARYRWVVLIGMGDEESEFPYERLSHPNMKLWIQSPIPGRHKADRFHLFGYMWDCHPCLDALKTQKVCNSCQDVGCPQCFPRPLDWFFAGQVTHDARRQMIAAANNIPNGRVLETHGFAQGLPAREYFELLSRSKIVLCPTGPACPDSFRFAESLEAGCIPIVDWHPSWKPDYPYGFWQMMFPTGFPFPIVENWRTLPFVIEAVLSRYDEVASACSAWWSEYKWEYQHWLDRDILSLGGCV